MSVGDGIAGGENDGEVEIKLPAEVLLQPSDDPISTIVDEIYPNLLHNSQYLEFFRSRAILAPTNDIVDSINDHIMKSLPGEEKEYLSSDSVCIDEAHNEDNADIFSPEFLNTVRVPGMPNHSIKLKKGCVIMLLRNLDQAAELCNGTRMIVTQLGISIYYFQSLNISPLNLLL